MNLPSPGQLLDLFDDNRIVAAVCLEERKGKLRILTESGRELNVSPKQVVYSYSARLDIEQAREGLIRALHNRASRYQVQSDKVDIQGLWEILQEDPRDYPATELADLALGDQGDDAVAGVLRALLNERIHFRQRPEGFRPTDPAVVAQMLTQRQREEEKESRLRRLSAWLQGVASGQTGLEVPPEGQEVIALLKEAALNGEEVRSRDRLGELLRQAGLHEEGTPFDLLVKLGEWSPHENLLLLRLGTPQQWPEEVLAEAEALANAPQLPWQQEQREDLQHLPLYTVDSASTLDVDDGLSLVPLAEGGWEVGIHITDVAAVVPPDGPLDQEARRRGTSVYLPDLRIPMLPPVLSENLCSLSAGQHRPAISLLIQVDNTATVRSWRLALTIVRVTERLTYDEVDRRLANGDSDYWQPLLTIAQAWRQARQANGALFLTFPEVTVTVGEEGKVTIKRDTREAPSQLVVSEMMIQANHLTATALNQAGLACVYRGQPAPRERILEGPVPDDLWINYRQRMQLSRAESKTEPTIHHGLGVETYTTASSPIRRYLDLTVQRQLRSWLQGKTPAHDKQTLATILTEIDSPVGQASQLEQNRRRYWLLHHLEKHRGLELPALVINHYGQRIQCVLPDYMLETALPTAGNGGLQPGQWLRVKISRVRAIEDILKVDVVGGI